MGSNVSDRRFPVSRLTLVSRSRHPARQPPAAITDKPIHAGCGRQRSGAMRIPSSSGRRQHKESSPLAIGHDLLRRDRQTGDKTAIVRSRRSSAGQVTHRHASLRGRHIAACETDRNWRCLDASEQRDTRRKMDLCQLRRQR